MQKSRKGFLRFSNLKIKGMIMTTIGEKPASICSIAEERKCIVHKAAEIRNQCYADMTGNFAKIFLAATGLIYYFAPRPLDEKPIVITLSGTVCFAMLHALFAARATASKQTSALHCELAKTHDVCAL